MPTLFPPGIRRLGAILACGLALWAVAEPGRGIADDSCGCGCPSWGFWTGSEPQPRDPWYFGSDGVAMQRLFRGLGPIATLGRSPSGALALSQQDLDEPFSAGAGLLLGHTFDDSPYQVEASYLWLSTWDTSAQASDPAGNLFSPFTQFGATPRDSVDHDSLIAIHEVSQLQSGEINLKCKLPLPEGDPTIALLFGVRYVGIREEFDYSSTPTKNPNPVSVRAHTNNDLWGPQIGGMVEYGHQDVWLRVEGTAALCNNSADEDLEANVKGVDSVHPRVYHTGTAEVADISATLLWRPTAGLTAKIGYQALWCDQLALAARNFAPDVPTLTDAAAEPPVNARGTLIYHGPFAGLQFNF